jgi:hypothetical protein
MTHLVRTLAVFFLITFLYRCEQREPVYGIVYLQTITRDYATVVYETEQPTTSRVDYCYRTLDSSNASRETRSTATEDDMRTEIPRKTNTTDSLESSKSANREGSLVAGGRRRRDLGI